MMEERANERGTELYVTRGRIVFRSVDLVHLSCLAGRLFAS